MNPSALCFCISKNKRAHNAASFQVQKQRRASCDVAGTFGGRSFGLTEAARARGTVSDLQHLDNCVTRFHSAYNEQRRFDFIRPNCD